MKRLRWWLAKRLLGVPKGYDWQVRWSPPKVSPPSVTTASETVENPDYAGINITYGASSKPVPLKAGGVLVPAPSDTGTDSVTYNPAPEEEE